MTRKTVSVVGAGLIGCSWAAYFAVHDRTVRNESNHFHRCELDYAGVYGVRLEHGQQSLYHRHDEDTLYVIVHATRVREQRLGEWC